MKLRFQLIGCVGVDFIAPERAESGGDWRKKRHLEDLLGSKTSCNDTPRRQLHVDHLGTETHKLPTIDQSCTIVAVG